MQRVSAARLLCDRSVRSPQFWLTQQTYVCVRGSYFALLDLANDRYFAIPIEEGRLLTKLVHGWPCPGADSVPIELSGEAGLAVATQLLGLDVLTTHASAGKDATPIRMALPTANLEIESAANPRARTRHAVALAIATISAARLRRRPISIAVRELAHRRDRELHASGDNFDLLMTQKLVGIFHQLRPYFFTSQNKCLFDSLALIEFLRRFGIFPCWVFGVQLAPFAAHCWVQQGCVVLNDTTENVRQYTPIMAA